MDNGVKLKKEDKGQFTRLLASLDKILIRLNGVYKVFKGFNETPEDLTENLGEAGADYVNAKLRIEGLNDLNRSGDIVLVMKDRTSGGDTPNSNINRFTTGVACKSWHGSMNPSDSYVPLIIAYPGGSKSTIEAVLTKDGICKDDYRNCKGNWNVTDIIKGFISEQYK